MKNKMMLGLLVLVLFALPTWAGYTIKMLDDSTPAYQAQILEEGFAGYSAGTVLSTFCLETSEYFYPGSSYYAVLNTSAIKGGKDWNGSVYGATPLVSVNADPLDERSAFLFTSFMANDSRFTDQGKLAQAIHYIEAESTTRNSYVTLAEQAVALNGEWYGKGIGNVRVMNLWTNFDGTTYSGQAQDQLIMIKSPTPPPTVPAPGAVVLASMGMGIVGYLRRRRTL